MDDMVQTIQDLLDRDQTQKSTLYLVGTPIGNLGDITLRALSTLKRVDFILAEDTRNSRKLLQYFSIGTRLVSYHEHNAKSRAEEVLEKLNAGASVALITDAGMPAISDPGEDIVRRCWEEKIEVRVVPGPTAVTSAVALSGLDTREFRFVGFLAIKGKQRELELEKIRSYLGITCVYEAPQRVVKTLQDFIDFGLANRMIAVARELTKQYEEVIRDTVENCFHHFVEHEPKGEFVLLIEGLTADEKEQAKEEEEDDLAKEITLALQSGASNKDIIGQVEGKTGIAKNQLKRMIQDLREKM